MFFLAVIYPAITDVYSSIQPESNFYTVLLTLSVKLLLVIVSFQIIIKFDRSKIFYFILIFLSYVFVLTLFSKDVFASWTRLLIVASNFLVLPASIIIFQDGIARSRFEKVILYTNIFSVIYIIYTSYFQIGFVVYGNEVLRFGGLFFFGLYLFVFSIPIFIHALSKRFSIVLLVLVLSEIALLFLSLKRTYLLFVGVFLFAFILVLIFFEKKKYLGFLLIAILIGVGFYSFDGILETQNLRDRELTSESLESEGRYLEYLIYFDDRVNSISYRSFIGQNPFANTGDFGHDNIYGLNVNDRSLHSDFVVYLYGIGIFGFILFIFIFVQIFNNLIYLNTRFSKLRLNKSLLVLSFTYFLVLLISHSIDGLYIYWARAFPFSVLGYLIAKNQVVVYELHNK